MDEIEIGMRVLVPFGGKKIYTGIVSELHSTAPAHFLAKEIINLLDQKTILPPAQLDFWQWLSDYYLVNLGEIYRFAFPSSLKLESETYLKLKANAQINFEQLDVNEMYLIQALEVRQMINLAEIEAFIPKKLIVKTINSLIDLQLIEVDEKIAEKYKAKEITFLKIKPEILENHQLTEVLKTLSKAPKQRDLFLFILDEQQKEQPNLRKSYILQSGDFSYSQLKSLVDKELVQEYVQQIARTKSYEGEMNGLENLSLAQKGAKKLIDDAFLANKTALLHGVTASGKTHLYLEKIQECILSGKNALVLLPEIALTKQIIQRLEKNYGKNLNFYHTKLTDFERVEIWRKVHNNEVKVLVGTRSALFLPYQNLGLIIVDEEHDSAYRPKEVSPYFNAKDAAQVLGKIYRANIILGSATPSVESFYAAKQGKINYIFLGERFGSVNLPQVELLNFGEAQKLKQTKGYFSNELIQEISENLAQKKQTIILHNRRGYANVVECETCGYVQYCSNCDVVMTYHKFANEMKCHYCGQKAGKPSICPRCNSDNINVRGVGIEQLEEELKNLFPAHEIDRMDVDSMRKKFAYEKLYEKIDSGEAEIILGTQMISKGLDFDDIELVAIPKADAMFYVQDFRAEERAYQLITQVSGRAGRVSGKGKILIQTYQPQHPVFKLIQENNTSEIYQHFLAERKKFLYPPFVKLIMIELKHRKEDKTNRASQFLGAVLRKYLPEECVLGPEKSPISKIKNLYQYQILLKLPKGKKYEKFKSLVKKSLAEFDEITAYNSIKKLIIVDF